MTAVQTTNIGYYTPGMPQLSALAGTEMVAADVPNVNGINPASGFIYSGKFLGNAPANVTGRFYTYVPGLTTTTLLTVASTLYAYPIYVPSTVTVVTLNLSVTTGQTGGAAHIGIYADNGAGYPGALVYDSGTQTGLTGTAVLTVTPTAGSLVLTPGWYWIASAFSASSTYITVEGISALYTNALPAQLGFDTAAHALTASGEAPSGISVAFTYGALPTTFTSGATLTLNAGTPVVALGV